MKKISLLILALCSSLSLFSLVGAVDLHVSLPKTDGYQDIQQATNGQSEISSNSGDVISIIRTINEYLWIAVGVVCMVSLVINGIKLITGRGDEAVMKKATNAIIGAIVGIVIAIFSYLIVRLVLNLF